MISPFQYPLSCDLQQDIRIWLCLAQINKSELQMFEQKYIVMETIGKSSEKMTSIVRDKQNNYYIAKKVPLNDPRTMHEISMMTGLSHPNIIALHELIEQDKWVYIIEEYCEEGDLEFHLKRQFKNKRLISEDLVARWMLQILLAIEYLHYLKIIHRDIRPRNIFLTAGGNIKLGSFKASKMLETQVSYAQTFLNSPYYMTPELMEGRAYDQKVDIWAFGCVLFEVCSLKASFSKVSLADMLNKLNKGKSQDLPYHYSKQLNIVYHKCMKRNPTDRLSAQQLLKTPYFLQAIQKFIRDKALNINLQDRIPIKRYNIHKSKYERIKIKKGLVRQKNTGEKRDNLLPKIQVQSNKIERKLGSREKHKDTQPMIQMIQTPIIKRTTNSKTKFDKAHSSEIKKRTISAHKPIRIETDTIEEKKEAKIEEKQKRCMLAPPLLPKPKKTEKSKASLNTGNPKTQKEQPTQKHQNFEMTMSKEQLTKQLINFQKKQLPQINEGLNRIFENLNIREDDEEQIDFDFVDQNDLRLTSKSDNEQQALLKTYKSKLEQLIEEINYKYCPDMEPIAEKTTQFDSAQFSKLHLRFRS